MSVPAAASHAMDLRALQVTLRQFAAERDWQPFHTPKNLAMALLVEAAELAEVFQWLTPEQSVALRADTVARDRVGDEVADVLLYLLQLADHCDVDLKRAVGRKLVKNARKHPPLRPGAPAGVSAPVQTRTHVLLDYENVQPSEDELRALVPGVDELWLFHSPQQRGLAARFASFGDRLMLVPIDQRGKNSLDFHLSFYLGYVAARHPDAQLVVLANDRGYQPMIGHAKELGFSAIQIGFARTTRPSTRTARKSAAPSAKTAKKAALDASGATGAAARPAAAKAARPRSTAAKAAAAVEAAAPAPTPAVGKSAARKTSAAATAAKKTSAKKAAAKKAAPKKTAAKKTVAKKAADRPATRPAPQTAPAGTAARAGRDAAADATRLVEALRKMGAQRRPPKLSRLRRHLASLLHVSADSDAVQAAIDRLLASGRIEVGGDDTVSYHL